MDYIMGLDIGIGSVGWSVLETENENLKRIADLGVRIFTKAENPKDGSPLALARREKRGARKLIKRRRQRMNEIKNLFISTGFISKKQYEELFINYDDEVHNPWKLRANALDYALSIEELARVLTHIAKRRGFQSNKKITVGKKEKDSDEGKLKSAVKENKDLLSEKCYRTVGEMFFKDNKFEEHKRNKGDYAFTVERAMLLDELRQIFEKQRAYKNPLAREEIEKRYIEIFTRLHEMQDQIDKVGTCTFESGEKRAPKMCFTSERFMLLQRVNNLSFIPKENFSLNEEQRNSLVEKAYELKEINYLQIRKMFSVPETCDFKGVNISKKYKSREETEKKTKFIELKFYHSIRDAFKEYPKLWEELNGDVTTLDAIGEILTYFKKDSSIKEQMEKRGIKKEIIEVVKNLDFSKTMNLSLKVINKILPFLSQGYVYSDACALAGYNHSDIYGKGEKTKKLPDITKDGPNNPVVKRALAQSRKVINAIIEKYGSPVRINIELAREMGKDFEERRDIQKRQDENRITNDEANKKFIELIDRTPKSDEVLKMKLYNEQNCKCAYSLKEFDLKRALTEDGYAQIDHIIPYSRCFDDSFSNKVLVFSNENQNKKNCTPYEYFGDNEEKWNIFSLWVEGNYKQRENRRKKQNLLKKHFDHREEEEFKARNLQDTQYITSYLATFIKDKLEFAPSEYNIKVQCVKGSITANLRKRWGLIKHRGTNDKHHSLDAVVIACVTPKLINNLTAYSQTREGKTDIYEMSKATDDMILDLTYDNKKFPKPYEEFREEIKALLSENPKEKLTELKLKNYKDIDLETIKPIFVSRMPNRKASGEAHEAKIRSVKIIDNGKTYKKEPLNKDTKLSDIENIAYKYSGSKWLYDELIKRVNSFDEDCKKAFSEEKIFVQKGNQKVRVRSIQVTNTTKTGLKINNGIANNGDMVRIDVFTEKEVAKGKKKKYYLVPLYVADIVKGELPNRAISQGKTEDEWDIMGEKFEFLFSLYSNDLFYLKEDEKSKGFFGYYLSTDRSNGRITYDLVDSSKKGERISTKTANSFEKFVVDILGEYHKVKKEVRNGI